MKADEFRWQGFCAVGQRDCQFLAETMTELIAETKGREVLAEMAYRCFSQRMLAQQNAIPAGVLELWAVLETCFGLLFDGLIDPAQALPFLASGIAMQQSNMGQRALCAEDTQSTKAVCYELQTLFPTQDEPSRNTSGPDVAVGRLTRKQK